MGRQINFYFCGEDESKFVELIAREDLVFVGHSSLKDAAPEIRNPLDSEFRGATADTQFLLCLRSNLDKLRFMHTATHNTYFVDTHSSPVIEYDKAGFHETAGVLCPGRIWFQMKYWDKDRRGRAIQLTKSKELERLYNRMEWWIRKHCRRLPDSLYMAPEAMELYLTGIPRANYGKTPVYAKEEL